MGGGVIREYDKLIYVFVQIEDGIYKGEKHWYISPFPKIKVGDRVEVILQGVSSGVPAGSRLAFGSVLRVENVTAQTAPFPVNRTREIERIL